MKTLGLASLFMPQTSLLQLLALAGLFTVLGLRTIAVSIFVMGLVAAFSPMFEPVFDALFSAMPPWLSFVLIAGLLLLFAGRFRCDLLVHVLRDLIASSIKVIARSAVGMMSAFAVLGVLWAALF